MKTIVSPLKYVLSFSALFCGMAAIALTGVVSADETGTSAHTISHSPTDEAVSSALFYSIDSAITEYISPVFETEDFNGLGLTWQTNNPELVYSEELDVAFYIRVDEGEWIEAPMMGHEAKDQDEAFVSHPLFMEGSQVQYKLLGPQIDTVRNVRITYFDSSLPPNNSALRSIANTVTQEISGEAAGPDIVTREEWGAEEEYYTWTGEAVTPEMFIIHHTAGGSGEPDPEAVMRGIYYWHSVVLGWGDIGYNYVVDQEGTIYEGRARLSVSPAANDAETQTTLLDVIGAHSYNSVEDLNYNTDSIGIAVMGCFESTEGACATEHGFNKSIKTALSDLIAAKSIEHGITPKSSTTVFGEKTNTIVGHRDVDYTYCPGSNIEDKLGKIRSQSLTKYNALKTVHSNSTVRADIVQSTFSEAYTVTGTPEQIEIEYENIGVRKWKPEHVRLQVSIVETGKRQGIPLTEIVEANGRATFTIDWTTMPVKSGEYTIVTKLYRKGKVVQGSKETFPVTITNPYLAKVLSTDIPAVIQYGWQPSASITLRNKSAEAWPTGSTITLNGKNTKVVTNTVEPGEKRTFTVPLNPTGKWKVGNKPLLIRVVTDTGIRIPGSRVKTTLRIDKAE